MKAFLNGALIIYAVILTIAFALMVHSATKNAPQSANFAEINVERINVREPDGTIRMALFGRARKPGIIVRNKSQPHPGRDEAGIVFYNNEGTEMGGLVFSGSETDGDVVNGGALTFDRYEQDQIVQVMGFEEGKDVTAGVYVFDRPEERMNFEAVERLRTAKDDAERNAAFAESNLGGAPRAFFGRSPDKSSRVSLQDGAGRTRLRLNVTDEGDAEILFLDEDGEILRRIVAAEQAEATPNR